MKDNATRLWEEYSVSGLSIVDDQVLIDQARADLLFSAELQAAAWPRDEIRFVMHTSPFKTYFDDD